MDGFSTTALTPAQPDDYDFALALPFTVFRDCGNYAPRRPILKGLLNKNETSSLIGPPGSGKSALQTEIAVHVAAGKDWRGYSARDEQHGVLILALERGDLYRRRLHAHGIRDRHVDLPIAVADAVIDLLDESCAERIISTVRDAEYQFGCKVGLLIIDTYAKGIAAGGGDEDKARDQNLAAAHLRMIHHRLDIHVALTGHTGKDESRGARGSNAHLGDVDVMIQLTGDKVKKADVIKANDQAERTVAEFILEQFTIGEDEDGDPITTAIVSIEEATRPASSMTVSRKGQAFLGALAAAVKRDDAKIIDGNRAITIEAWKREAKDAGLIDPENSANSARSLFSKHRRELERAGRIVSRDGWVWITPE